MNIRSFAEVATKRSREFELELGQGYHDSVIPAYPEAPELAYLRGIAFSCEPESALQRVTLVECNGMPICQLSGENLRIISYLANSPALYIPIQIADDGRGCLANMSAACSYRLQFETSEPCIIKGEYLGRELADAHDLAGMAQAVAPPYSGMLQFWTSLLHYHVDPHGDNGYRREVRFQRVGNIIRNLVLVARDEQSKRYSAVLPKDMAMRYDLVILPNEAMPYQFVEISEGVFHCSFGDEGLRTVTATYLALLNPVRHRGTVDILFNDISAPFTLHA